MKVLAASIVFGPLMLIGALPAAAGPSTRADTQLQSAADSDAEPFADRDTYNQKATDRMTSWQQKVRDFDAQTAAKGKEAGGATEDGLNDAWAKTEAASQRLQSVSDDGWQDAKRSFEKASQGLAGAWHKVHPDDK